MTLIMIGFVLGFFSSVPIGALGAYMINRFIRNGFWDGFTVGIFASVADALYCVVSLIGMAFIYDVPVLRSIVQALGLMVLLYIGGRQFFSSPETSRLDDDDEVRGDKNNKNKTWSRYLKDLGVVFSFGVSNPTLWAFWTNVAQLLHLSTLKRADISEYLLFINSVGIGSMVCQYVSLRLIGKTYDLHRKARVIIHWISASVFLVTVLYFGYHLVLEFTSYLQTS
jgi:threonine/homoserine/homoserine lactone efflux protein